MRRIFFAITFLLTLLFIAGCGKDATDEGIKIVDPDAEAPVIERFWFDTRNNPRMSSNVTCRIDAASHAITGAIDGATGWAKFKNLTFPLIIPFFSINMVLCMKNFLMVFDQIMALTKGGPAQSTESISYLIYNNGMSGGQFGFQSANAVIFFIVIVVISVAQMKFTGSKEEQL